MGDQSPKLGRGRQWMCYIPKDFAGRTHQRIPSNTPLCFVLSGQVANRPRRVNALQDAYPVTSFAVLTPKPSPCRSKAAVRSITFPLKDQTPNCHKSERFGVGIPTTETSISHTSCPKVCSRLRDGVVTAHVSGRQL